MDLHISRILISRLVGFIKYNLSALVGCDNMLTRSN
jgi:hypothetical protein